MEGEIQFPVVAHHRIIVDAARADEARARALFTDFDLAEPFAVGHASSSGKYVSYALSVRLADPAEMNRLDEAIKAVPGIKMCL